MKLIEYLNKEEISVAEFAKLLNVSRVTVYDYLRGKKRPSEENFIEIASLTRNKVLPNDFYDLK